VNSGNTCTNIAEHIEQNSVEWYKYIYYDRICTQAEKDEIEDKIKEKMKKKPKETVVK
jgi:tRNA(Ser,Leu) C12 N-acetylase TAN1